MSPSKTSTSPPTVPPLDPTSEWRAWQTLKVLYTLQLNQQIRRRCNLEQKCMEDRSLSDRFRPLVFLEPVPTLQKPSPNPNPAKEPNNNPFNETTMDALRTKVKLLRARVEKGKELAAEIERRMALDPPIKFPTHFCHNCVQDGEMVEVLLTKCGHRVCRTCLDFLTDADGQYECSICFVPAEFVARSPLALIQDFPEIPTPFKGRGSWDGGVPTGDRDWDMSEVLFSDR